MEGKESAALSQAIAELGYGTNTKLGNLHFAGEHCCFESSGYMNRARNQAAVQPRRYWRDAIGVRGEAY